MELNGYVMRNIDKGMRKIIKILNQKNYITRFCCEGHPNPNNNYRWEAHIFFEDDCKFSIPIPLFEMAIDNRMVNRRQFEDTKTPYSYLSYHIHKHERLVYKNTYQWVGWGEEKRQELLATLLEWAKSLPQLERHEIFYNEFFAKSKKNNKYNRFYYCYSIDEPKLDIDTDEIVKEKSRWYYDFEYKYRSERWETNYV